MKRTLKRTLISVTMMTLLATPAANATNGYFKIGYGAKNRGLAGAGLAYGQDALASAVNPAALSAIGNRADAGLEIFNPKRKSEVDASAIGGAGSRETSGADHFAIPNFGISKAWSKKVTLGVSAVANGGMNTRYGNADKGTGNIYTDAFAPAIPGFVGNTILALGGDPTDPTDPVTQLVVGNANALGSNPDNSPALGVNLAQLLITPTIAVQVSENHSVGFAPVIGYQRFRAYGLGLFAGFSSEPNKLTNNGDDDAWGIGARVGYQGRFGMFSFGAAATSKIYMEAFDKYAGLFAERGDFDIPATYGGGIALHVSPRLTIAADVSRIMYGGVNAINNDGPTANEFFGALGNALANPMPKPGSFLDKGLGKKNGFGFGWDDVTVYKIGVDFAYSTKWTFRAGFNYAEMPYDEDQALFNVLAPAVVEKHVTAGFTYAPSTTSEVTVTVMHAFENDVEYTYRGTGSFTGFSYTAKNEMFQNAIEASYGIRF